MWHITLVLTLHTILHFRCAELRHSCSSFKGKWQRLDASVAPPTNATAQNCLDISELPLKAALITAVWYVLVHVIGRWTIWRIILVMHYDDQWAAERVRGSSLCWCPSSLVVSAWLSLFPPDHRGSFPPPPSCPCQQLPWIVSPGTRWAGQWRCLCC